MKKTKIPGLIISGVLTVITILFWVGFEVYRAFSTQTPPSVPQAILVPLDPKLDLLLLNKLPNKINFSSQQNP